MRTLPDDDYQLRNCGFELFGTRSGRAFMFGDVIRARLTEASPVTGGLIFKYVDEHDGVDYLKGFPRQFPHCSARCGARTGNGKSARPQKSQIEVRKK